MAMLNNQMVCVSFRVFSQGQHSRRPEGLGPCWVCGLSRADPADPVPEEQLPMLADVCPWVFFGDSQVFPKIVVSTKMCRNTVIIIPSLIYLISFWRATVQPTVHLFLVSVRGSSRALCRRLALWVDTGDLPTKWTLPQPKLSCESTWAKNPFLRLPMFWEPALNHLASFGRDIDMFTGIFGFLGMIFFCWVNLFWDFWYIDEPTHIDTLWLQCKAAFAMSCLPSRFGLPDGFQISVGILQSLQFWWFVRCIKPDT